MEESRRLSCSSVSSIRRASICSSRITEIPVESILQQSKVETLQWQLKETEKSREMYKAMMKQVVTFLERAHKSLELLENRMNSKQAVPRSKSEHQIIPDEENITEDYTAFRDFTWRRPKRPDFSLEEIPPGKLSQEAFRLLRNIESLLSTQEPKLAPTENSESNSKDDIEFLAQLAHEFPRTPPENRPQRTTSFSLSPKLILPETETKISTAFNRKLSLQLNESRKLKTGQERARILCKSEMEKPSPSPPGGSISSVEDESGFSSMNSFQDVGLPIINTNNINNNSNINLNNNNNNEQPLTKNCVLKSMLQQGNNNNNNEMNDIKLWQKSDILSHNHKRWSSTPVDSPVNDNKSMKVLWV